MDLGGVTPPIIRERLTYGIVVCFIVCYPITRLIININYRLRENPSEVINGYISCCVNHLVKTDY